MFSMAEKRHIAEVIEKILLDLKHPEMPTERPLFRLNVQGKECWSWAEIEPNWTFDKGSLQVNKWNEVARDVLKEGAS
jgi:hypothetical protein